ncbi:hypothetical protein CH376_11220 [Leptospira adleri]|uniref:Glycosyl transferase family 28 C-terminal domain-containing protein n=2 Tax=Leptospira adleri TaxID=2023186 RepID=A0ABX4P104_9LEPT|nr:hypothetical protein CH376_11220 [Leptospira adleri]
MTALSSYFKSQENPVDILLSLKGSPNFASDQHKIFDWLNESRWYTELQRYDFIIMDSYLAGSELIKRINDHSNKLVVIDDFNRIEYSADLLINPNVFFSKIDYQNQKCKTIGGSDFVILRESFRDRKKIEKTKEKKILISIGGSDYRRLLPKLASLSLKFEDVTIVCPESDLLTDLTVRFPNVRLLGHLNEARMVSEISSARIVISGCGQSLNELYNLQKNTIGICIDHDQILNQEYYYEIGFLRSKLSWDSSNLLEEIEEMISNLFLDPFEIPFPNNFNPTQNLQNYIRSLEALRDSSNNLN